MYKTAANFKQTEGIKYLLSSRIFQSLHSVIQNNSQCDHNLRVDNSHYYNHSACLGIPHILGSWQA